ncbi:MAG: polyprenyl synthetase family protein [Flavobacteriales bacterium]|nr:polyprenyl synthetase family protein [Flavobacteriales bacterium]
MRSHDELYREYGKFQQALNFSREPVNLYEPIGYLLGLGGKRMRPVLNLLAYELIRPADEHAFQLAHSIEVFHNFTLMHDDIMDEAPLRRGHATVHERWNIPTAILSGDLMLIQAYSSLQTAIGSKMVIWQDFNKMAEEVCKGQQMDMDFASRADVTMAEYLQMIDWKTAVLLAFSLKSGATLAGAHESVADHLYAFGMKMGRGFQLMDDYLDTFGDPEKVGKQPGGDIIEGKKTFLLIHALEQAGTERSTLLEMLAEPDKELKVRSVRSEFEKYGSDNAILQAIESAFRDGYALLERIPLDTTELEKYVKWLEGRAY